MLINYGHEQLLTLFKCNLCEFKCKFEHLDE